MLYSRDLLLGIKHNSVKDEFWLAVDIPICSIHQQTSLLWGVLFETDDLG